MFLLTPRTKLDFAQAEIKKCTLNKALFTLAQK